MSDNHNTYMPIEFYTTQLADIRDMFPVPEEGSELYDYATRDSVFVPAYVKCCLDEMKAETVAILRASNYSADLCTQALDRVREQDAEIEKLRGQLEDYKKCVSDSHNFDGSFGN